MSFSIFYQTKRNGYRAQRSVSQGADITLLSASGGYVASFECATAAARVLGNRGLQDLGNDIESIPHLFIPTEAFNVTCAKLSLKHSVALVDLVCDGNSRFALVWKIERKGADAEPSLNPDDY